MSNPKVVVRYRNRRHNRRNRGRRRNPGILNGDAGKVASLVGGIAVTGLITGFLPSTLTSGVLGSVTTGVVAVVAGQLAGKMMKSPQMGNWVTIGGLLIVGLQLWQQFFPQYPLAITTGGTSTGTSGMGLITSSNFYVPQVNVPGSMATFVTPAGIPVAVPTAAVPTAAGMSALRGLGATRMNSMNSAMRRIGRLR